MKTASHHPFLNTMGLRRPLKKGRFVDRISRQYGDLGDQLLHQINERYYGNLTDDFWETKNSDATLSLLLSSQFNWEFYQHYLSWCDGSIVPSEVESLLDVGCDNGILTCYYAYRFPNARIVGLDKCRNAISVANLLADRLNLKNISFEVGDVIDTPKILKSKSFSLITAIQFFSSAYGLPSFINHIDLPTISDPRSSDRITALQTLKSLMNATASMITADRLTSPVSYHWWSRALFDAQLAIQWKRSTILSYGNEGIRVPIFVADNQRTCGPSYNDTLSFHSRPELEQLAKNPFYGSAAEALFNAFSSRELVWGIEGQAGQEFKDRLEVWNANTIILAYESSNREAESEYRRRLVIAPAHSLDDCIASVRSIWKTRQYGQLHEYRSVEEREIDKVAKGTDVTGHRFD